MYLPRRAINRRRHRELAARIDRVRGASLSILAPMREASFHTVATSAGTHRGDPYAGPVLDRLAAEGGTPLRVVIGMEKKRDREWRALRDDDQAIPLAYVARRWPPPPGSVPSYLRLAETLGGIRDVPMLVDGVDLGPFLRHRVTGQAWWLRGQVIAMRVAEGLMADLRPSVMLTGWEASRTAWLGAARRTGVPIVAIQHGVIYPRTPDYVRPPDPAHVRAELTCLFGTYERDLLVNEGGYPPEAVAATGSPRATPRSVADPGTPGERGAIRQQLAGVALTATACSSCRRPATPWATSSTAWRRSAACSTGRFPASMWRSSSTPRRTFRTAIPRCWPVSPRPGATLRRRCR